MAEDDSEEVESPEETELSENEDKSEKKKKKKEKSEKKEKKKKKDKSDDEIPKTPKKKKSEKSEKKKESKETAEEDEDIVKSPSNSSKKKKKNIVEEGEEKIVKSPKSPRKSPRKSPKKKKASQEDEEETIVNSPKSKTKKKEKEVLEEGEIIRNERSRDSLDEVASESENQGGKEDDDVSLEELVTEEFKGYDPSSYEESFSNLHQSSNSNGSMANLNLPDKLKVPFAGDSTTETKKSATVAPRSGTSSVFENVSFVGRELELERLQQAQERTSLEWMENPAEVVWIVGEPGIGKSTLARAASGQFWKAFVCRGSCEQHYSACKPFKPITDCLNDLLSRMEKQGGADVWRSRLEEALGGEGPMLAMICPKLLQLMHIKPERPSLVFESNQRHRFNRLAYAVRDLFRLVAEYHPIVMIIDDLEYIDPDSLQLIQDLLTTKTVQNLLLIGCHDNVLYEDHPLTKLKENLLEGTRETILELQNFDEETTDVFIHTAFVGDELDVGLQEDVDDLSHLLAKKTEGNPFEILQWLKLLYEKQLITYSAEKLMWNWDYSGIKKIIKRSENKIVDLISVKIEQMPKRMRLALTTAAAMKLTHFRVDTLHRCIIAACRGTECPIETVQEVKKIIGVGLRQGLLKQLARPGYFKFAHNMIREAATSLLPREEEGRMIHFRIGTELSAMAVENKNHYGERERLKIMAADQLNRSSKFIGDPIQLKSLAKINLEAAEVAMMKCAFRAALSSLQTGINYLGPHTRWGKDTYELALRLAINIGRMKYYLGDFKNARFSCDEMLKEDLLLKDRSLVNHLKILVLIEEGLLPVALDLALASLKDLGEEFPSEGLSTYIYNEVQTLRKVASTKKNEELLNLPPMQDKKTLSVMALLAQLYEISRLCDYASYQDLVVVRMMGITLREGYSRQTTFTYSLFGVLLICFGLQKEAFRFGRLGERLTVRPNIVYRNHSLALFYRHVSHWRRSYRKNLEPLLNVYNNQIDAGDFDHVIFTISSYIEHHVASGFDLRKLKENMVLFEEVFSDYNLPCRYLVTIPHQFLISMMVTKPEPLILLGDTEEDQNKQIREWEDGKHAEALQQYYFLRMFVAIYFNNMEVAEKMRQKFSKPIDGVWIPYQLFFDCLIIYTHVRSSKGKRKQKYQEKAIELTNKLTEWYNDGADNCEPLIALIEAEALISTKDPTTLKIKKVYEEAIQSAKDAELLHIEALACERAALYFIEAGVGGNGSKYLANAYLAYERWGATAKATQLEQLYPRHLDLASRPQRQVAASYKAQNNKARLSTQQREIGGGRHDIPSSPLNLVQRGVASSSRRVKQLFAKKDSSNSAWGNISTSNMDESASSFDVDHPSRSPFRSSRLWGRSSAAKLDDDDDGVSPVTSPTMTSPKPRWGRRSAAAADEDGIGETISHKPPRPQSVRNAMTKDSSKPPRPISNNKDSNQADEELPSPSMKTPKPRLRLIPRLRKGKKDKDKGDTTEKGDTQEGIAKVPEL
jgi:predicted ATPase